MTKFTKITDSQSSHFVISATVEDRRFATENAPWRTDAIAPSPFRAPVPLQLSIVHCQSASGGSITYPPPPPRSRLIPSRARKDYFVFRTSLTLIDFFSKFVSRNEQNHLLIPDWSIIKITEHLSCLSFIINLMLGASRRHLLNRCIFE